MPSASTISIDRDQGDKFTHPTKQVFNCLYLAEECDIVLEVNDAYFLSKKAVLKLRSEFFSSLMKESSGWTETRTPCHTALNG